MRQQTQQTHSKLDNATSTILTQSNLTSTMNTNEQICGEQLSPPPALPTTPSASLRSLLKTSGLFNIDLESSDKLNELFANTNEFTLHRLLSDKSFNDMNIDMNELVKFDPMKLLDTRSLSEFFQCDLPEQSNHMDNVPPSAIACSSETFAEFRPPTPEFSMKDTFHLEENQLKVEPENPLIFTQLNSFENFILTPSTSSATTVQEFNFDPSVLAAFEHDYGYLSKRSTISDTPSPSPTISKRTSTRRTRRTSTRLQSRSALNDGNQFEYENLCLSSESTKRTKFLRHINRASDIQNDEDLSYYLERRRKNNEASKMSRAARKQKFGDMNLRCAEYERVNAELRSKISTLENVTANLRNGLINNFQRKTNVDKKF